MGREILETQHASQIQKEDARHSLVSQAYHYQKHLSRPFCRALVGNLINRDAMIPRMLHSIYRSETAMPRVLARVALLVIAMGVPSVVSQVSQNEVAELTRQARAAVASGQLKVAVASYEKAIQVAPKVTAIRLELGAVLTQIGRIPDAIAVYHDTLRIAPHNLQAEIGLARAYRGVPNFAEAKQVLETAAREHATAAAPLATMGDIEIQLQTYDEAIVHLKAAVRLAPADIGNRNLLAAAYKAKGDPENALAELRRVLVRDPDNALARYLQAEIYADRNQDELALNDSRKVVALQPKNPRARVLLGKILLRTVQGASPVDVAKRCSDAVAALEPVAKAQGQAMDSESLFLLSRAYRCAGQPEQADKTVAAFEAASQSERSAKEGETQSRHLVQEANDAALKNDLASALDLVRQALAKNPNDGAAYSLLAKIHYSSGEIDKASDAIAKALDRAPFQPDFLYVQGKILQKQGKLDQALAAFAQTTLVNSKESDAYFEAGTIYQSRHDRARARAAFKKAVELSPDDADYRRALASVSGTAGLSH